MDLSTIGSVSQYTKTAALKAQWSLKQKSGGVSGRGKSPGDSLSVGGSASQSREDADDEKLQKITAKASAGAKLTEKEMEYLRERNPQLYEKLRQIEREQKAYEEALRRCKTKDEAQRLHVARVGEIMESAKNGDGMAAYRMNRMTESMTAFTGTEEYERLPTEAEESAERVAPEPEASGAAEKESEQAGKAEETAPEAEAGTASEPRAAEAKPPAEPVAPKTAGEPFGAKAYRSRQEEFPPEDRRHKVIDVDA